MRGALGSCANSVNIMKSGAALPVYEKGSRHFASAVQILAIRHVQREHRAVESTPRKSANKPVNGFIFQQTV